MLTESNIHFIKQGIDILESISDHIYAKNNGGLYNSGVGKHFRHIIDHYDSFLQGYAHTIDYDHRKRSMILENNRDEAIKTLQKIVESLAQLPRNDDFLDQEVLIQSNATSEEEKMKYAQSSIRREFQFLISHTVHHYSLIKIILKSEGIEAAEEFGIAPSTLSYLKQKN